MNKAQSALFFDRLMSRGLDAIPDDCEWLEAMWHVGDAAIALDRADTAEEVTRRLAPLFMSRIQSCRCSLSLSDEYASWVPSGDHAGSVSSAASLVRFTGLPPTGIV